MKIYMMHWWYTETQNGQQGPFTTPDALKKAYEECNDSRFHSDVGFIMELDCSQSENPQWREWTDADFAAAGMVRRKEKPQVVIHRLQ